MQVSMARGVAAQVVLLPDGLVGTEVLSRVRLWASEGLLDPVFWVPASQVKEHRSMPAKIEAIVIGRDTNGTVESRTVPLLATLGREAVDEVVVSSVRWLTEDASDREAVSVASARLLGAIKDAVPLSRQVGEVKVGGTSVRSLNIVFAATKITSDELAALLSSDWEDNIVVSPEDRQRPHAADRFTDAEDTESWASFMAASVATIAGLWAGYTSTLVPRITGSGMASRNPMVRVARTFARGVVSGDFSVELARAVAASLVGSHSPLRDPAVANQIKGIEALNNEEVSEWVTKAVGSLVAVDGSALSYRAIPAFENIPVEKVSFGKSLSSFTKFSVNKLVSIPVWMWEWVADKVSRRTKKTLYGTEEGIDVDTRSAFGLSDADRDLLETGRLITEVQASVLKALDQPPLPVTTVPAPTLWKALRSVVFTLIDGGSASEDVRAIKKGQGGIGVVADVGMVIPAPWETWELPTEAAKHLTGREDSETVVTWTELAAARELLAHLTERTQDLEHRFHDLDKRYTDSRHALINAEREFVEARELWEDLAVELDESNEALSLQQAVGGLGNE